MKNLIFTTTFCLSFIFSGAQNSIKVEIGKKVICNQIYITTIITNYNEDAIILINHGKLNEFGQILDLSSCYSIFSANINLSNLQNITSKPALFIDDSTFPNTKSVKLNKGESYSFMNLLYDSTSNHWKGIFPKSYTGKIAQITAKLHLKYLSIKNLSMLFDVDFVSNKLTL